MYLAGAELEVDAFDRVQATVDLAALDDLEQRAGEVARLQFHCRYPLLPGGRRRREFDQAVAPLGGCDHARADRADRGDAVDSAVDTAVQAFARLALRVEPSDQAVGARRGPRLLDPELLDAADLGRLTIVETPVQGRTDPQLGRNRLHHRLAKLALAEHEFGELRAQAEKRQPIVPVQASRYSSGIAGVILDDGSATIVRAR